MLKPRRGDDLLVLAKIEIEEYKTVDEFENSCCRFLLQAETVVYQRANRCFRSGAVNSTEGNSTYGR